jgi:hypothetical protein
VLLRESVLYERWWYFFAPWKLLSAICRCGRIIIKGERKWWFNPHNTFHACQNSWN